MLWREPLWFALGRAIKARPTGALTIVLFGMIFQPPAPHNRAQHGDAEVRKGHEPNVAGRYKVNTKKFLKNT
jgi:hypothetical protein